MTPAARACIQYIVSMRMRYCKCQDAGLHALRQAAKKERIIDEHRLACAEQYIIIQAPPHEHFASCARVHALRRAHTAFL
jgi:hypothetical protein